MLEMSVFQAGSFWKMNCVPPSGRSGRSQVTGKASVTVARSAVTSSPDGARRIPVAQIWLAVQSPSVQKREAPMAIDLETAIDDFWISRARGEFFPQAYSGRL